MNGRPDLTNVSCPVPLGTHDTVQMAHGGGGRLMRQLIEDLLLPSFRVDDGTGTHQRPPHDSAVLPIAGEPLALTTDSFVVNPLFFPGGDIGKLAVCGTVNDLAMAGATPRYLTCSLIIEEGLPLEVLRQVMTSMRRTADHAGVHVVTGDTKVVDRGKGDGLFVNTAGVGIVKPGLDVNPARVAPGDRIVLSGDIGRHGVAIMSVRESLEFEGAPDSDCAPLAGLVESIATLGPDLHCMRDLTRGGLAAALIEIAEDANVGIDLDETAIAVEPHVAGACELLGLDPLYVANEGRMIAIVPQAVADQTVARMKGCEGAPAPVVIGEVTESHAGDVEMYNAFGNRRLLDLFSGEQMPRIC